MSVFTYNGTLKGTICYSPPNQPQTTDSGYNLNADNVDRCIDMHWHFLGFRPTDPKEKSVKIKHYLSVLAPFLMVLEGSTFIELCIASLFGAIL